MKIGQFVQMHIKKIFHYCDTVNHEELMRLMDDKYSKKTFKIGFPFCAEVSSIPQDQSKRYWTQTYLVRGITVRVSSQWFDSHVSRSRDLLTKYLLSKSIISEDDISPEALEEAVKHKSVKRTRSPRLNSRYRGNAIGNAQNLVIRNILSNLGKESFNEKDWQATKLFFSNRCAYCGVEGDLLIEHAIPINKKALGEHRLGNLVPSCRSCNSQKGDKNFKDFLDDAPDRIRKIEEYMDSRNYVPLGNNDQVKIVLELAYDEVSRVAGRYIAILNELFPNN